MIEITIPAVSVTIRTVPLTAKLLKQMRTVSYDEFKGVAFGSNDAGSVLGWVAGSVFDPKDNHSRWLIVKVAEGDYGRFKSHPDTAKKYPQIYV